MCQSTKPKGEVPERTEEGIWGRWGKRSGWAQKPGERSTGTEKVLLSSFTVRASA